MTFASIYQWVTTCFENAPLANLVEFILAISGIVLSIMLGVYFYYLGKKSRKPVFVFRNTNLIKDKIEDFNLEISYQRDKIDNLSIARFAIWNAGGETIRREDIAEADPIKIIALNDTKILEAKIIFEKNSVNRFKININPTKDELAIEFDFFDKNEGIVLQIFHTGKDDDDDLVISGTVKGFGKLMQKSTSDIIDQIVPISFLKYFFSHRRIVTAFVLFVTPVSAILSVYMPRPEPTQRWIEFIVLLVLLVVYWSLGFSTIRRRIPKGFEIFDGRMKP